MGARRRPGGAAGARTGRARQSRRVARYTARRRLAARHAAAAGPGTRAMTQPAGTRPDVLRDILRRKHEEVTERAAQIGNAAGRERGCLYVEISGVAG